MANIKIVGTAAVLTSGIKVAVINTLKKFKPAALKLIDAETKDEKFVVKTGDSASIANNGIIFNGKNGEDFAQATVQLPASLDTADKKKAYVQDNFGYALLSLNKLEAQVTDIMTETEGEFITMAQSITAE